MKSKSENAAYRFNLELNCAQAVIVAFQEEADLPESTLLSLGSGFGGGMARQQMTCGAVTGSYMVIGLLLDKKGLPIAEEKKLATEQCKIFSSKFLAKNPSLICRDILGADMNTEDGMAVIEKGQLFNKVCTKCVTDAVDILDHMIEKIIT